MSSQQSQNNQGTRQKLTKNHAAEPCHEERRKAMECIKMNEYERQRCNADFALYRKCMAVAHERRREARAKDISYDGTT